jgi:hypothetical protein
VFGIWTRMPHLMDIELMQPSNLKLFRLLVIFEYGIKKYFVFVFVFVKNIQIFEKGYELLLKPFSDGHTVREYPHAFVTA